MIELADYQIEARDALLANRKWGLFDEQGVGKTFPLIAAAWELDVQQRLVTVPAYLIPNWEREIRRYCGPDVEIAIAVGEPHQRHRALTSLAPWVLTSYHNWSNFQPLTEKQRALEARGATVTRTLRYPELMQRRWGAFLYDEAHRLRGRNSMWTKEMRRLQNADSKNKGAAYWYATGTPIVRDPGDVFEFLRSMDRTQFSSYWRFVEEWCLIEETPWDKIIHGIRPGLEEAFKAMLDRYSTRRLLADIPELAKLEVIGPKLLPVKLPASVYTTMRKATKDYIIEHPDLDSPEALQSSGQLVHRLRLMSSLPPTQLNPMLETVNELLDDHVEPVIVWTWYRETANRYVEAIDKRHRSRKVFMISGDVSNHERQGIIDAWGKTDDGILVATVAALKEGANLQHSACQIFVEVSDLPSDNDQAIGRSKRRGQLRPVHVYALYPESTLAAKVYRNQSKRRILTARALLEEYHQEVT
jgi:SNF2 family DNA or RNA helicase